jgi:uncharacterized protein (TIGR00369 family)
MTIDAEHFRKLENMYAGAPINRYFQPRLSVRQGKAELRISIRPDMFHAAGATHGSVYFKAMDDSAFFAANSLVEDVYVLTTSFNVHLLRPIAAGEMIATGTVVGQTRTLFLAESVVVDSEGNQLGRGTGTFVRSRTRLTEEVGYRL